MNINNESQKQELFKTIWDIANELRNKVDSWDFKSYILGFLFYRYLSQDYINLANKLQGRGQDGQDFDYASWSDDRINANQRAKLIEKKGYYIAPSQLFQNFAKLNETENEIGDLNEKLSAAFKAIEDSSQENEDTYGCLNGLFKAIDLNAETLGDSRFEKNQYLLKIIKKINEINFGDFDNNQIDIFGDAYEYLIRMYASSAGKSGGEYYTPQEVSDLLFKLALGNKKQIKNIYDPTCGSGSLLLKAAKIIGLENIEEGFYGQEINIISYNLARINMFLHNVHYTKLNLARGNTLLTPKHKDKKFEIIVSNPPYSTKWPGKNDPTLIEDERFSPAGILAPAQNSDFAFIMHSLYHLSTNGSAAIVCFNGIMHRRGAEQKIRQYLVDNNFISAIIQLPANIFYGTNISTVIMVLSKAKIDGKVVFIDAANEYQKVSTKNQLNQEHINKIVDSYLNCQDVEHFARVVDNQEIAANDYDLSVSRYVKKLIIEEVIDIDELEAKMEKIVESVDRLRADIKVITQRIRNKTFLEN